MLFKHQKEGVDFILKRGGSGSILWDIGCGKTRGALELFTRLREKEQYLSMIVICPLSLIEAAWGIDIKKWTDFIYQNLHEHFSISLKYDIYLLNYESLYSKEKFSKLYNFISEQKCMVVIDESSRMKDAKSKTSKSVLALREKTPYRIIMSGTPAPNSPLEYYSQMEFIAPNIFGSSFYRFRNTFFHLQRGKQIMIRQGSFMRRDEARELFSKGWKYDITEANRQKLMVMISPYCHYAKKEECLDWAFC